MKTVNEKGIKLDILKPFKVLWLNLGIVLLITVICALLFAGISHYVINPVYEADIKFYINNTSHVDINVNDSDSKSVERLIDTYIGILESRSVLNEVIELSNLNITSDELLNKITAKSFNDTELFIVSVKDNNPETAKYIANTIAEVLPYRFSEIVDGAQVRIVDYAITPSTQVAPCLTKDLIYGAIIGFILSWFVSMFRYKEDNIIHSYKDLKDEYSDIPILGVIPNLGNKGIKTSYTSIKDENRYLFLSKKDKGGTK